MHSTLNSLNGLLYYETATGGDDKLREARHQAEQYSLQRRLLYTLSTGKYFGDFVTTFAYPFRWPYTALRALDYFYRAAQYEPREPHAEFADAAEIVRSARNDDGTWTQQHRFPARPGSMLAYRRDSRPSGSRSTRNACWNGWTSASSALRTRRAESQDGQ